MPWPATNCNVVVKFQVNVAGQCEARDKLLAQHGREHLAHLCREPALWRLLAHAPRGINVLDLHNSVVFDLPQLCETRKGWQNMQDLRVDRGHTRTVGQKAKVVRYC